MGNWILLATMLISCSLGVLAVKTALDESDRYFDENPSWDRIGSYRIPYGMMIGVGLCLVPAFGIAYSGAMWAVYLSGKRFE